MEERAMRWKRTFFSIWIGQQISLLGSMLAGFALIWWVTRETGSAAVLASLSLVQALPGSVLGPFVGALIDRWDRRRVMLVADTVVAIFSLWLVYLFWVDGLQMWHVYVISVVRALGGTFHWPAMAASTSLMVPDAHLSRVAGMNHTVQGIWNIVSPPLGALVMEVLPLHGVMMIDGVTAICAILPLVVTAIPQPEVNQEARDASTIWSDMREGFSYVLRWPGLVALLVMAALVNLLLNPAFSLLPLMVTDHFGGEALQLSWMNSALGVGFIVGGLLLSIWGGFKRRIVTTLFGLASMGVAALAVGAAPPSGFVAALIAMFLLGVTNPITNGPIHAIYQSVIPPEMQGRVLTVIGSVASGMSPLGLLLAGQVANRFRVGVWFTLGGVICVSLAAIGRMMPAVMQIEDTCVPSTAVSQLPEHQPVAATVEST